MATFFVRLAITFIIGIVVAGCEYDIEHVKDSNVASEKKYQSPIDGKLTEKQVADYIVIRKLIIAKVSTQNLAKKIVLQKNNNDSAVRSNFLYFDEIERMIATSFNMSYDEYLWIKDTVISTQTTVLVQHYYDLNNRIMTLLDKTLSRFKEINTEQLNHNEQIKMDGYVEEMKQELNNLRGKTTSESERPDALAHNIIIISKYKNELELIE
jgi:hypothetical protein